MADIHANGKMSAKITVGTVEVYSEGIDPDLVYTKGEINKLLEDKSDINHEHKEYLTDVPNNYAFTRLTHVIGYDEETGEIKYDNRNFTQDEFAEYLGEIDETVHNTAEIAVYNSDDIKKINKTLESKADNKHVHSYNDLTDKPNIPSIEGLASEEYVNNQIDAIPEVDLSNCATKEELNEVKQSVSNGKELLASAITDKGIETLATDSFEIMANNISKITTSEEEDNTSFSVEYTLAHNTPDNTTVNDYNESKDIYPCLPRIYTSETDYSYTYDKLEITLLDGTITNDTAINVNKVKKIKIWYPEDTIAVKFYNINNKHLVETIDYIKTDNFTDMSYMFNYCGYLKYINLSNFNTSNVTNMRNMFNSCQGLTSLDLSNFNTSNVTNIAEMFRFCQGLTSLDLSSFNTSKVTDMSSMFSNCTSLTSLDLSNFNTSNVTIINSMFNSCSSLTSLDLSNFNTSNVITMSYMFKSVPTTVDWKYDGTNYTNFTLTETQTKYSGTFPWNLEE